MKLMNNATIEDFKYWLRADYERNKLNILMGGWTAIVAHPAYYFLCSYVLTGYTDSAFFRFGSVLISFPLIADPWLPKSGKPWLNLYWYCWITFILPVTFTYILLINNFALMWVVCETMMISLTIVFIGNFVRVLLVIGVGVSIGYLCYKWHIGREIFWNQSIEVDSHPIWHLLVPLPIAMWCGVVFMLGARKALVALEKNEAIKALAGSIAHEMRNPLGQIKYALDGINKILPNPNTTSATQRISMKMVNEIYSSVAQGLASCNRGLQVIDTTLHAVSNRELDSDTFEYLSALKVTERAIDEYSFDTPSDRTRINFKIVSDFTFKVDENAYIFIVFNIIKNAVYYFKSHPDARIGIVIDKQKISITDSGPGIPDHILCKLFKEFTTIGKKNGTGLGLAYCARTMQAFKGKISCESVLGKYSKFILDFPPVDPEEVETYISNVFQEIAPFFVKRRILIVDDEIIYHTSLNNLLRDLKCSIDPAGSAQGAMNLLKTKQYDLIIMDLNMPDKDGYATTQEIRLDAVPGQKDICIVAHTSEPYYLAKIKTEKVGMDGFITKPCTRLELVKVLQQAIEHSRQRIFLEQSRNMLKGKTVLITDDELFNRQFLEMYAKEWHMNVYHADNGQEALDVLEKEPQIDIVFMDILMPVMGGIEATHRIRANPAYKDIIIVAVSGNFDEETTEQAVAAGMNDFFTKPMDRIGLKQKLIDLLIEKKQNEKTGRNSEFDQDQSQEMSMENLTAAEAHTFSQASSNCYLPLYKSQDEFFKDLPLLDFVRLSDSKSGFKDKFQNLFHRMVGNLNRRDLELQLALNEKQPEAVLNALHSLMGVAGYVGAHALHQYVKLRLYPAVLARQFPDEEAWAETVHDLVIKSIDALYRDWVEKQLDNC